MSTAAAGQTHPILTEEQQAGSRRWLALAVLLTGAFLPILDFNVVNLALPAIRQNLGASSSEIQFVLSAYAATYAVFLITGGRLGDLWGRKRMFTIGVAGFTLASLICGLASSPSVLIAGRMLQGLTATIMAPQVLASIRVLFNGPEQARALALYGAAFGLANICGQILGGVLVSLQPFGLTWQAVFLINIPIGAVALFGSLAFLGDSRAPSAQRFDLAGVGLLSLTLLLLIYPLVEGRETGWPSWMIVMLLAFVPSAACFIVFEQRLAARGGDPLVLVALFRERSMAVGVAMAMTFYMLSSFYLTFSVYLQSGLHLTPLRSGLATLPFAIGYFLASLASSPVMARLGPRALTVGFAIQVVGFGIVLLAAGDMLQGSLNVGLACAGIGFGIVMPAIIKAVIGAIPPRHAGLASGVMISTFQIGAALGVALIGGVFYASLGAAQDVQAYARAFQIALGCNIGFLLLGGLLSLWLRKDADQRAA